MTVRRTYSCNLCGAVGDVNTLVGIEWPHPGVAGREAIRMADVKLAADHLCKKCVEDVARMHDKLNPKR